MWHVKCQNCEKCASHAGLFCLTNGSTSKEKSMKTRKCSTQFCLKGYSKSKWFPINFLVINKLIDRLIAVILTVLKNPHSAPLHPGFLFENIGASLVSCVY